MRINRQIVIEEPGKTDLHMHTTYCDGRNTPEEMIRAAVEKGFSGIGFSGHSFVAFDRFCGMPPQTAAEYLAEIHRLREKYRDRIRIWCGIEQDYESNAPTAQYDYVIGSVHYLRLPDVTGSVSAGLLQVPDAAGQGVQTAPDRQELHPLYAAVDDTPEIFRYAVEQYFGGDYYLAAEQYFANVADVVRKTGADIIGHFDLFSKFNEKERFFDEQHPRYRKAWKKAADALLAENRVFEINTGAISRGWRTVPYPSQEITAYLREHGGRFILSSDSHRADTIGYGFADILE